MGRLGALFLSIVNHWQIYLPFGHGSEASALLGTLYAMQVSNIATHYLLYENMGTSKRQPTSFTLVMQQYLISDLHRVSPPLIIDFYKEQSLIDGNLLGRNSFRLHNMQFLALEAAYVLADIEYNLNPMGNRMNFQSSILENNVPVNFLATLFQQPDVKHVVRYLANHLDHILSPKFVHDTGNVFRITSYLAGLLAASVNGRYTAHVLTPSVVDYRLAFLVTDTATSTGILLNPLMASEVTMTSHMIPRSLGVPVDKNIGQVPGGKILVLNIHTGFDNGRLFPVDYIRKKIEPATVVPSAIDCCYSKHLVEPTKLIELLDKTVNNREMTVQELTQKIHNLLLHCDHVMNGNYELNGLLDGLLHYERCQKTMPLEVAHGKRPLNVILLNRNLPVFFNIRKIASLPMVGEIGNSAHNFGVTVNFVHYLDSESGKDGRTTWTFLHGIDEHPIIGFAEPKSCT